MTLVMSHCIHLEICSIQCAEISYGRLKTWLLCLWVSSGVPWHFSPMYTKRSVGQKIAPDVIKVLLILDHDFLIFFLLAGWKDTREQTVILQRSNQASCGVTERFVTGGFKVCTLKIICWGNAYLKWIGCLSFLCILQILYCFCILYLFIYYIVLFFHLCAATNAA